MGNTVSLQTANRVLVADDNAVNQMVMAGLFGLLNLEASHSLKGSCLAVGANEMSRHAAGVEHRAAQGDLTGWREALTTLESNLQGVRATIAELTMDVSGVGSSSRPSLLPHSDERAAGSGSARGSA